MGFLLWYYSLILFIIKIKVSGHLFWESEIFCDFPEVMETGEAYLSHLSVNPLENKLENISYNILSIFLYVGKWK